jgi:hypothetical protein
MIISQRPDEETWQSKDKKNTKYGSSNIHTDRYT